MFRGVAQKSSDKSLKGVIRVNIWRKLMEEKINLCQGLFTDPA